MCHDRLKLAEQVVRRSLLLIDVECSLILKEAHLVVSRQGRVREIDILHPKFDGKSTVPLHVIRSASSLLVHDGRDLTHLEVVVKAPSQCPNNIHTFAQSYQDSFHVVVIIACADRIIQNIWQDGF